MATITSKHDVRRQVSSIGTYFGDKITALNQINELLHEWNFQIDPNYTVNLQGDSGNVLLPITVMKGGVVCDCCEKQVDYVDNMLSYSWYKMQSGRFEITVYIS